MEEMMKFKTAIVAVFSAAGTLLGWRGIMGIAWVAVMLLDYASGTMAARKTGSWSSRKAREGLWHKGGMILVVTVAGLADIVMGILCRHMPVLHIDWPALVLPLVLAWYIITELGSVLENALRMGARVPEWLVKMLKLSLSAVTRQAKGKEPSEQNPKP